MPAPTNISFATAHNLGDWPIIYSQTVTFGGLTYTTYYTWTATSSEMVNLFAWGGGATFIARATLFASDQSTVLYNLVGTDDLPWQFPVVNGHTYYLKVASKNGNVADGTLTITGALPPVVDAVAGDLLINDDWRGNASLFPPPPAPSLYASILNQTTGALKQFRPMVAGEFGDVIPDGAGSFIYGLTNDDEDPVSGTFDLVYYDAALAETSRPYTFTGLVRALQGNVDRFYVADSLPLGTVKSIGRDGAVIGSWSVGVTVRTLAANRDNTILYYGVSGLNNPIQRWDLVNDTALSDLVSEAGFSPNFDSKVLANGHVLITWTRGGSTAPLQKVSEYLADGTLVREYVPTIPSSSLADGPRLTLNKDDTSSSFWVWLSGTDGAAEETFTGRFILYSTADGSTLTTFDVTEFEKGRGPSGLTSAWPTFGNSKSCPLVMLRQALPPLPGPTPIYHTVQLGTTNDGTGAAVLQERRLRRSPHQVADLKRIVVSKFQVHLQTGIGNSDAPDPQVMFRVSKDGGHTWSNERLLSAGAVGAYTTRAIAWRLGQGRDWVFEIAVSDPNVPWAIVDAYLDAALGTS